MIGRPGGPGLIGDRRPRRRSATRARRPVDPRARRPDRASLRNSCTNWTAIDPSPTADATRLIEPDRTSPAANTPGRLVSSRNGLRPLARRRSSPRAVPVRMNPFSSLSISPGSQSVRGTAPMKLNSAGVWMVLFSPVSRFTTSTAPR